MNVGFLVTQKQLWQFSHLLAILRHCGANAVPIVGPNLEQKALSKYGSQNDNAIALNNSGIASHRKVVSALSVRHPRSVLRGLDWLFVDQPTIQLGAKWDVTALKVKLGYVPYGLKVSPLNEWNFCLDIHRVASLLAAESPWHYDQLVSSAAKSDALLLSGYPKLDLVSCAVLRRSKSDRSSPKFGTVLWAPHWSVQDDLLSYGTFDVIFSHMLQLVEENRQIRWVLRAHERLPVQLAKTGIMSGATWSHFLRRWEAHPNAVIDHVVDSVQAILDADAVITDSGSLMAEAVFSRKPVLVLRNPRSRGYNDFGQKVVEACNVIDTNAGDAHVGNGLRDFVRSNSTSTGSPSQRASLFEEFGVEGCASSRIASRILGMANPDGRCLIHSWSPQG
jgi:hypothetical protein